MKTNENKKDCLLDEELNANSDLSVGEVEGENNKENRGLII